MALQAYCPLMEYSDRRRFLNLVYLQIPAGLLPSMVSFPNNAQPRNQQAEWLTWVGMMMLASSHTKDLTWSWGMKIPVPVGPPARQKPFLYPHHTPESIFTHTSVRFTSLPSWHDVLYTSHVPIRRNLHRCPGEPQRGKTHSHVRTTPRSAIFRMVLYVLRHVGHDSAIPESKFGS
ncbi:hypothetical protein AYL99_11634 [Fonsecaea erecta]|uniref:Uncharacterized protein n=1 Tax=Fonsecaea erecta TaxID=1367422 RepID=A0A178Z2R8_9EURO|nr:hypothetical protein AYL99_11634 [Fonsecaea erecta]OAP54099.1 hypothetical protein AYL99_11634 [Fonsecaea erecta]